MAGENVFGNPIIIPAGGFFGFGSDASDSVVIAINAGDPNGVVSANVGSFILDTTTPALWQNTDGATAWANASAAAPGAFFQGPAGPFPGAGPPILVPHGLGRVPNFVQWSLVAGTDGADGPGVDFPVPPLPPGAPFILVDAVNIIIDSSLVAPGQGGFVMNLLAG